MMAILDTASLLLDTANLLEVVWFFLLGLSWAPPLPSKSASSVLLFPWLLPAPSVGWCSTLSQARRHGRQALCQ